MGSGPAAARRSAPAAADRGLAVPAAPDMLSPITLPATVLDRRTPAGPVCAGRHGRRCHARPRSHPGRARLAGSPRSGTVPRTDGCQPRPCSRRDRPGHHLAGPARRGGTGPPPGRGRGGPKPAGAGRPGRADAGTSARATPAPVAGLRCPGACAWLKGRPCRPAGVSMTTSLGHPLSAGSPSGDTAAAPLSRRAGLSASLTNWSNSLTAASGSPASPVNSATCHRQLSVSSSSRPRNRAQSSARPEASDNAASESPAFIIQSARHRPIARAILEWRPSTRIASFRSSASFRATSPA